MPLNADYFDDVLAAFVINADLARGSAKPAVARVVDGKLPAGRSWVARRNAWRFKRTPRAAEFLGWLDLDDFHVGCFLSPTSGGDKPEPHRLSLPFAANAT